MKFYQDRDLGDETDWRTEMSELRREQFHPSAVSICQILQNRGFEAYIVGGAVRDALLGLPIADEDIATSATPEQVQKFFFGQVHTNNGERHGSVLVQSQATLAIFDVTTFRKDVATDGRNATVEYGASLAEDLARRDFGINAFAFNPINEELIGHRQSYVDLENKVVRFVGDGYTRIMEDRLRFLRGIRFKIKMGGEIAAESVRDMNRAMKDGLLPGPLSMERVRDELFKILKLPNAVEGLQLWEEFGLLGMFLEDVDRCRFQGQNKHHNFVDVLEHTYSAVDKAIAPEGIRLDLLRFAVLLHDIGKPKTADYVNEEYGFRFLKHEEVGASLAEAICIRFLLSKDDRELVTLAVREHMSIPTSESKPKTIRKWIRRVGIENVPFLLEVRRADGASIDREVKHENLTMDAIKEILGVDDPTPTQLTIDGDDVMRVLDLKPGRHIGDVLTYVRGYVDENPDLNEREHLLESLPEMYGYILENAS